MTLTPKHYQFKQLVLEKNEVMNLTSIKDPDEFEIRHFYDSLYPARFMDFEPGLSVVDIGTGGGFPGIPLAISYPSLHFTLVDSTLKKLMFLDESVKELGLKNVTFVHGRLEDMGRKLEYREKYDRVLARGLAPLNTLLEYVSPLLKIHGKGYLYKGPNVDQEIKASKKAFEELKLELVNDQEYEVQGVMHHLLTVVKIGTLHSKYPRENGTPKKKPL